MFGFERLRMGDQLLGGTHFGAPCLRIRVTEEQIAREFDRIAELPTEQRMHGDTELLPDDVETRELERRVQLRAIVVEARGRIADREAHRLEPEHVVPQQIALQRRERACRVFAAAAHFAEADVAVPGLDFDDRPYEAAPMRAIAVQQRCFERYRDRGRADRSDRRGHRDGYCGSKSRCRRRNSTRNANAPPLPPEWRARA